MATDDTYLNEVLKGEAFLLFDGAMGTMLQERGMPAGALPELLNLTEPSTIEDIHASFVAAGSQVVTMNTFGANARKLAGKASVAEVFAAAASCARRANARYIAADIGPTGALLKPLGTLSFDEAYALFEEEVIAAVAAGADLILIETMTDLLEAKAAVLAAKEQSDLPVFATMSFEEDGNTFLGTSPEIAAITLSALGVDALGINCSLGPADIARLVSRMLPYAACPVMVQANAGLPHIENGMTRYGVAPGEYCSAVGDMLDAGVTIIGGCCGTTPDYIAGLADEIEKRTPVAAPRVSACTIASSQRAVILPEGSRDIAVIGERINPTGKKRLKEALRAHDLEYVINEAIDQQEAGADILDVNVGLPEIDEPVLLGEIVDRLQAVTPLPLQIDSGDPEAIEAAVRRYGGKPIVNSVNGTRESLDAILPLIARYGCSVVGLTLDEDGIPSTAEGRFAIAQRIVGEAARWHIPAHDVLIDCLVMTASTNQQEVCEILRAVTMVKERLGVRTVLGVSNVSFGLPHRELVNATFLAAAFGAGLDLPILNPLSQRYRDVVNSYRVLNAQDAGSSRFIAEYAQCEDPYRRVGSVQESGGLKAASSPTSDIPASCEAESVDSDYAALEGLVLSGRKGRMEEATRSLLAAHTPLEVINDFFIPALDVVGERFEAGKLFLPQLMASAEAVKAGFDVLRERVGQTGEAATGKGTIVLATVKGDIHDIGKNIVRMLLENYGFDVIDLGRDVEPQAVLDAVLRHDVTLVGLSALMTTSLRGMEDTIALLREQAPDCKIIVGGAVLNPEYAQTIGADYYAKDAAASARIAERHFAEQGN